MSKNLFKGKAAYSAPVVRKTMKVLDRIVRGAENPGINEIAAGLSLAKSTTHGILSALEESGWVVRDPVTRKYTCGHVLKDLADMTEIRLPIVHKARSFLERLSAEVDEDVFLGMFTRHYILILDQVESSKKLKVSTRPGTRLSIFAGAAGKIFLAHHDPGTVSALIEEVGLPRFTPRSIMEPSAYLAELEKVRREGVALDVEEYIPDVRAVAVPVFHGKGNRRRMVAGVWIVGLSSGLNTRRMEKAAVLARRAGEAVSKVIDGSG